MILFGVVGGALDGPNGGVLPGVVEERGVADRRSTVPVGLLAVLLPRLVDDRAAHGARGPCLLFGVAVRVRAVGRAQLREVTPHTPQPTVHTAAARSV
ncbi:hypothetical protein, partial [Streptomyces sp. NPDC059564]|uniref:hypothetical protein n=1 Tax=Streptomyces sp. NPDC059564 TaxID=3346865 RepID=UPI0036B664EE